MYALNPVKKHTGIGVSECRVDITASGARSRICARDNADFDCGNDRRQGMVITMIITRPLVQRLLL